MAPVEVLCFVEGFVVAGNVQCGGGGCSLFRGHGGPCNNRGASGVASGAGVPAAVQFVKDQQVAEDSLEVQAERLAKQSSVLSDGESAGLVVRGDRSVRDRLYLATERYADLRSRPPAGRFRSLAERRQLRAAKRELLAASEAVDTLMPGGGY